MKTMRIKDAKMHFIESGRLNRNVIRDEISISWYKCKLSQLDYQKDTFDKSTHNKKHTIETDFLKYLDAIIPASLDYWILDLEGMILSERSENFQFKDIWSADEENIGTNAAALTLRYESMQRVLYDEHFLEVFSSVCTYAIPLKQDDQMTAILALISKDMINEYMLNQIVGHIQKYNNVKMISKPLEFSDLKLENMIIYPKVLMDQLKENIEKISYRHSMVLVRGNQGSGRTTVSWFLGMQHESTPYYIASKEIPKSIEKELIEKALYQNETVIIDDFEYLSDSSINLLMVYNNEKFHNKNSSKYSNYKALNVILTTVNNIYDRKLYTGFVEILKINQLEIKNLNEMEGYLEEIKTQVIRRLDKRVDFNQMQDRISMVNCCSIKDLMDRLSGTVEEILLESLEQNERKHILSVLKLHNFNITLASDVLGISRSTLYRKMEKYQIDTEDRNPK